MNAKFIEYAGIISGVVREAQRRYPDGIPAEANAMIEALAQVLRARLVAEEKDTRS